MGVGCRRRLSSVREGLDSFLIVQMWKLGAKGLTQVGIVRVGELKTVPDGRGREIRLNRIIIVNVRNLHFRYLSPYYLYTISIKIKQIHQMQYLHYNIQYAAVSFL